MVQPFFINLHFFEYSASQEIVQSSSRPRSVSISKILQKCRLHNLHEVMTSSMPKKRIRFRPGSLSASVAEKLFDLHKCKKCFDLSVSSSPVVTTSLKRQRPTSCCPHPNIAILKARNHDWIRPENFVSKFDYVTKNSQFHVWLLLC